jgi:hypothetical protein
MGRSSAGRPATRWRPRATSFQVELCGPREQIRAGRFSGMIPAHLILDRTLKSGGVSDCVDSLWVRWGDDT